MVEVPRYFTINIGSDCTLSKKIRELSGFGEGDELTITLDYDKCIIILTNDGSWGNKCKIDKVGRFKILPDIREERNGKYICSVKDGEIKIFLLREYDEYIKWD